MEIAIERILESLSPNERKILPYLEEKSLVDICKKASLDKVSVLRSLEYLKNKGIAELLVEKRKIVQIGLNGALYRKKGLPERRLMNLLNEKRILKTDDAKKKSSLSEDEFRASLGVLKKRGLIELKKDKIIFSANKEEISKKSPEESFLESLPLEYESFNEEQKIIFEFLKKRKDIVQLKEEKIITIKITNKGRNILEADIQKRDLIEQITPELLKKDSMWKGKKFRRYDVRLPVSSISGGKRHFVNQATDYARKIWLEMGFQEMEKNLIVSSFWNFDALFTAQDHPVREMQDTFFLNSKTELPEKELIKQVKKAHEQGVSGSKGWQYSWNEEDAKNCVLRTHTTCLSAQKLYELSKLPSEKKKGKFFAVGKVFRNETIDWSHSFEFNQTEGIVVDKNVNFQHLLGYLKEFFKKMGFEKIRIRPAYFPYTEPSVEIDVWHPERKEWLELCGAGIFRPEVVIPLLGENLPVLAWGPGIDRILMDYYQIKDIREMYKNDFNQLRKIKFWIKS